MKSDVFLLLSVYMAGTSNDGCRALSTSHRIEFSAEGSEAL